MCGGPPSATRVADASSVLVLRPQSDTVDDAELKRTLVDDPTSASLVGVSLSEPPSAWYDEWCSTLGCDPDAAAVITTPELTGEAGENDVIVETVAAPSNLTRSGVKATTFLSRWDGPTVVVERLSVLFQCADARDIYEFLHVVTTQLRASSGDAQVDLDPTLEDDRTVERLEGLFDAVVEYDAGRGDGSKWTVRRRRS